MGYPVYMFWKDREGYENLFYGREGVSSSSAAALNVTTEQLQPDAPDTLGEGAWNIDINKTFWDDSGEIDFKIGKNDKQ